MSSSTHPRGGNVRKARRARIALFILVAGIVALGYATVTYSEFKRRADRVYARFTSADGVSGPELELEVALNDQERQKGLMYRNALPPGQGMIFVFPKEKEQAFWMKDTLLSLDMIFIDSKFKVVGILRSVPPMNLEKRTVEKPSQYVVELFAGSADAMKIAVGSELRFKNPAPWETGGSKVS